MNIINNYSISRLFITKDVDLIVDKHIIKVHLPVLKDFYIDNELNAVYHLWTSDLKKLTVLYLKPIETKIEIVTDMLFRLGQYKEYWDTRHKFEEVLKSVLPDVEIDYSKHEIRVSDLIITDEIWEHVLYLLRLSCGEKIEQPLNFKTEDERRFWMAQQEAEARIRAIKQENAEKKTDYDGLAKMLLAVTYKFPSLTIDYLCNQTMAQIHWLQTLAAGAVSYEVNAQAYAAGNIKKGQKLEFFIK